MIFSNWPAALSPKQCLDSLINKSSPRHYYPTLVTEKRRKKNHSKKEEEGEEVGEGRFRRRVVGYLFRRLFNNPSLTSLSTPPPPIIHSPLAAFFLLIRRLKILREGCPAASPRINFKTGFRRREEGLFVSRRTRSRFGRRVNIKNS